ncbi:NAD-dependent epimerase/dehydratase family protein [Longimicrobium sp.]|uniref:NAD-dependent epimerase/dehydratase family protein n=1 Tax=Longimicrobium sp. TaxID=2029185 RepID=UPI002C0EDBDA|nr:NAD-dependent epimerase/dehydratase family protein [Longimicrobium sp.]HSU16591.1 NAD-dependent epimerase/dehydratase family protein [Longimicrobium sp.]
MRILIVGGTGFIGRAVVRAMHGHELALFHRGATCREPRDTHHLHGDRAELLAYRERIRALRPDVVLDMVPRNGPDAQRVIDAVRGIVPRVVAVSSGSVYRRFGVLMGSEPGAVDNTPSREDSPLRTRLFPYRSHSVEPGPLHDYDKIPAEQAYFRATDLACSVVRLPMVYGPGDPDHRLTPYVRPMLDGRPEIPLQETAARWRNARSYVDNAAAAIARVVEAGAPGRAYNVAELQDFTELEWIRRIGAVVGWQGAVRLVRDGGRLGRPSVSELPETTNFAQHLLMDSSRIRGELGYTEVVEPEEALCSAVRAAAAASAPADSPGDDGVDGRETSRPGT